MRGIAAPCTTFGVGELSAAGAGTRSPCSAVTAASADSSAPSIQAGVDEVCSPAKNNPPSGAAARRRCSSASAGDCPQWTVQPPPAHRCPPIQATLAAPSPDLLTMMTLMLPLIGLYELGLILARFVTRKRKDDLADDAA